MNSELLWLAEIFCVVRENKGTEGLDETDVDLQQNTVSKAVLQNAHSLFGVKENML